MKAAVLHGYDEALAGETFVTYEDVADPQIAAPTDVIVRIGGAGVCPVMPTSASPSSPRCFCKTEVLKSSSPNTKLEILTIRTP